MKKHLKLLFIDIKSAYQRYQFLLKNQSKLNIKMKLSIQIAITFSFLLLTIANIYTHSPIMIFTALGCIINGGSAYLSKKYANTNLCSISSIISCSLLFLYFLICGGNDGFAGMWMILLPFSCMMVMDFVIGFFVNAFLQIFIILLFWTPLKAIITYPYNYQFCLRFPLLFFVSFILGLSLTILLQKSQYDEFQHALKLEKMTEKANNLAKFDFLTGLPNRRYAYEIFSENFDYNKQKCIVMGDLDYYKKINDTYGHEFGDEVLITVANIFNTVLPKDYFKCRWGGEEFLFVANDCLKDTYEIAENLRIAIAEHKFYFEQKQIQITITFGIAEYKEKDKLNESILLADKLLYKGKKTTKNCTVIKLPQEII